MIEFIKNRWPQYSSKLGTALTILPVVVPDIPTWGTVTIVVVGIVFFGVDEDKVVERLRK